MITTQESFNALLAWLDPDREGAAKSYELIRAGLLRIFVSKGFSDAEDLVDQTIDRVINRLPDIQESYEGEPIRYFYGVARHILQETSRRKEVAYDLNAFVTSPRDNKNNQHECLEQCLKILPPIKRELILDYHLYEGHQKIEHHRRMAFELAISENALRGRAHHIRANLEKCVRQCTQNLTSKETKTISKTIAARVVFNKERQP